MKAIETERLVIRPFVMDDLEEIHKLISYPQVAWIGGQVGTMDRTRQWLGEHIGDANRHFGTFAIVRRTDNVLVGLIALGPPYLADFIRFEDAPNAKFNSLEVELGYALAPEHWGNGYASEAGKAMVRYAFEDLKLPRIVNSVRKDNTRSINVMKRLGFRIVANAHPQWSNEVLGVLYNRSLSEGG